MNHLIVVTLFLFNLGLSGCSTPITEDTGVTVCSSFDRGQYSFVSFGEVQSWEPVYIHLEPGLRERIGIRVSVAFATNYDEIRSARAQNPDSTLVLTGPTDVRVFSQVYYFTGDIVAVCEAPREGVRLARIFEND